jgi:tetratricopeptide (TPR) repeat protein
MLSISVAVYNLPDLTRRCFESLDRTLAGTPFEVLVYDNHSTDPAMTGLYGSLDSTRYKVVHSPVNRGYRGAHRDNATRCAGDWFVIINNDLVFEEVGWDRKLVAQERLGAVGIRGEVCNAIAEGGAGYFDPRAVGAPMYVDGHFMAIPRTILLEEGLFEDEQIDFCYFEDSDHSFTLRQKGYTFAFVPIRLTHFRGSTTRSLGPDEQLFLVQTFERNRRRFHAKWGGELGRLRGRLSWSEVALQGCPKRPSAQTPIAPAVAQVVARALDEHKAGRLERAEALYRQAISKGSRRVPAADNLLAALLMDAGKIDAALVHAKRATAIEPGNAYYLATRGNAEQASGRVADAFGTYLCAKNLNPSDEYVLYNLGRLCLQTHLPGEAIEFYRQALKAAPAMIEARYGLGRALAQIGRTDEALEHFQQVIAANPAHEHAALELSNLYVARRRYDAAEQVLREAVVHRPRAHALHNNLGVALHKKGDPGAARAQYALALEIDPDNAEYLSNYGLSLAAANDVAGAIAAYRRAIERSPNRADAHWNLALALLVSGHYLEGWREYRWGMATSAPRATPRVFDRPAWDGSDPSDKRILLYAEQGFGDTFQFVRYARLVNAQGGRVILQCQRGLKRILSAVPGVECVLEQDDALPEYDLHASVFDAPRVMGTTVETIPRDCGYLRAEPPQIQKWHHELSSLRGLKVGLAWQGRTSHEHDHLRSIQLASLSPLLAVSGVSFVSLQKGFGSEQIAGSAFEHRIVDRSDSWDAEGAGIFLDAAGIITNLDLVITVDSAIAHLAGALGRPVWTLLQFAPDWRWMLGSDRTPWYPSMRLFRQTTYRDWSGPVTNVVAALRTLAQERQPQAASTAEDSSATGVRSSEI